MPTIITQTITLRFVKTKSRKWIISETKKISNRLDKLVTYCQGYSKMHTRILPKNLKSFHSNRAFRENDDIDASDDCDLTTSGGFGQKQRTLKKHSHINEKPHSITRTTNKSSSGISLIGKLCSRDTICSHSTNEIENNLEVKSNDGDPLIGCVNDNRTANSKISLKRKQICGKSRGKDNTVPMMPIIPEVLMSYSYVKGRRHSLEV